MSGSMEFLEGSSLSDPMEAICRVTSKNCVQKEYVLEYMSGPRLCFVTLMFQMCGCFVVFFGSGQRKRSCDYMLAWWQRRMRRSVSSPTSTVLLELADCTAFITIRRSALPEAWCTSQLFFFNSSLSMKLKHCLFCLLARNCSFFMVTGVSAVNVTVVPAFPFDRLWCVMSYVCVQS